MIRTRHCQPSLWSGVLAEDVGDLWEPWMRTADRLLDDEELVGRVYEAQARRFLKSRTRGRRQTPAEVVLRLLILKHVRDWSYEVLEREVRANLVYRTFARIGSGKASKRTEFGKLVKIQEAENQIVTHFEVYQERPTDSALLVEVVEIHQQQLGSIPHLVAADAGFYSQANEKQLKRAGREECFGAEPQHA